MKKTTIFLTVALLIFYNVNSQCEAPDLATSSPDTADNSGSVVEFAFLFAEEYTVLTNLIAGNTYEITTTRDPISPSTEAYITLRQTIDNAVVASGYTPLLFSSSNTELEVHFYDEDTCDPVTDTAALGIQNQTVLSLNENIFENLKIYPNPVKDQLYIKNNKNIISVTIVNIIGKQVLQKAYPSKNYSINTHSMENGVYFLNVTLQNGQTIIKKIIKN